MVILHLVLGAGFGLAVGLILGVTLMALTEAVYEAEPGVAQAGKGIRAVMAGLLPRMKRP